jgi:LmbE family N-acetylglucosaminyl deacetylase
MIRKTVLVIAAHPDDDILGCGGTMARHSAEGDSVNILVVADGESSRQDFNEGAERAEAARRAAGIVGARLYRLLGLPDQRLDTVALLDITRHIEKAIDELRPDIVYTHQAGDLNEDHCIVHRAVLTACRPLPGQSVRAIYGFEVPSSTEWGDPFSPNHFVDIDGYLDAKRAALDVYAREMRPFPHARSREAVEALAILRGASVGLLAAEAFMVLRQVIASRP